MAMDADGRTYATVADLLDYCYCVAGVVGLMMCHVLGVSSDDALPHAAHLGIAMQLTNICRDVREDFERGRSYLPVEMLPGDVQWAIARDVEAGRADTPPALRTVVRELLGLAESYYRSGDEGLQYLAPRCALSIRTARMVYSGIGRRIEAANCNVLAGRSFLTKGMKLRLAGAATARSLFDLPRCLRVGYGIPQTVLGANDVLRLR
jgi:phytoene synthase